jgi:site-specific recombinase XerD
MKTQSRKRPLDPLTREEARAICDAPSKRCPTGLRNRALLAVIYRAGLRISEALALEMSDVDFERSVLCVRSSKTANGLRLAGIDKAGLERIAHWILARREMDKVNEIPFLFITWDLTPVSRFYAHQMVRRMAKRAGVDKRVHPHAFRHAMAMELLDEGAHLAVIRDQLGHSSIAVTDNYLNKLAFVRKRMDHFSGRSW